MADLAKIVDDLSSLTVLEAAELAKNVIFSLTSCHTSIAAGTNVHIYNHAPGIAVVFPASFVQVAFFMRERVHEMRMLVIVFIFG